MVSTRNCQILVLLVLAAVLVQTFAVPMHLSAEPQASQFRVKRQWGGFGNFGNFGNFGGGGASQSQVSDQSGSRTVFEDIKTPFGEIDIGQTQTFNNFQSEQSNVWG